MTQENKELLLKDLCSRLPYGVKGITEYGNVSTLMDWKTEQSIIDGIKYGITKHGWRPYLFPLSSMTEEQVYNNPIGFSQMLTIKADRNWENITINRRSYYKIVDWFNKNHFDYRGLIPMGLAIDCTNLNIY